MIVDQPPTAVLFVGSHQAGHGQDVGCLRFCQGMALIMAQGSIPLCGDLPSILAV